MTLENVVVNLHLNAHTLNILPRIYQATSHSCQLTKLMTRNIKWLLIILCLMLHTSFQKLPMDEVFSISGWLNILGWDTVRKQMVDFVFPVSCFLIVPTSALTRESLLTLPLLISREHWRSWIITQRESIIKQPQWRWMLSSKKCQVRSKISSHS